MNILELTLEQLKHKDFQQPKIQEILQSLGTPNCKIFCLYGDHGAGKDVWASILNFSLGIPIFRFSDYLRTALTDAGISMEEFDKLKRTDSIFPKGVKVRGPEGLVFGLSGLKYRDGMIHLAEECIKPLYGSDFFAKVTCNAAKPFVEMKSSVIFTDQRFPEELTEIENLAKANDFEVVKLRIPEDLPKVMVC